MIIFAWVGSPLFQSSAEQNWITDGGGNYGNYSNSEVDKLTREGATSFDLKAAGDKLNQADEILSKEAYVLPISQKPTMIMTYQDWVNVRNNSSQWSPMYNIQEWGQKAA